MLGHVTYIECILSLSLDSQSSMLGLAAHGRLTFPHSHQIWLLDFQYGHKFSNLIPVQKKLASTASVLGLCMAKI